MSNSKSSGRRWFRFTVGNLLMLTLGIAIGFVPLRLWEFGDSPHPTVLVQVQLVEVERDSLPALGIDRGKVPWAGAPLRDVDETFASSLESLRQKKKAKILANPTLVTLNGHAASYLSGGEFPFPVLGGGEGNTAIEFRPYGTRVDLLPTLLRNGRIRLEISPSISEIDNTQTVTVAGITVPAVHTRSVETEVELDDGETVVFGGFQDPTEKAGSEREILVVATVKRNESR